MDSIPLYPEELYSWIGKNKSKCHPAQRLFTDVKMLMNYMQQHIMVLVKITVASVDVMYKEALPHIFGEDRSHTGESNNWLFT